MMNFNHFTAPEIMKYEDFVVRSYLPGDGERLAGALNASYDHLSPWMPWAKPHTSVEDAERTSRIFRARYLTNQEFVLAVLNSDETQWLGSSGFHLREGTIDNRAAEIGMWIHASFAGQGLGTRVLCAILDWGFSVWPWERLSWRCSEHNLASRRTAEKANMVLEATLRGERRLDDGTREDTFVFSALREEWANPSP
jgi:RimJ/RimL family protein N-acetyltransferase